MGPTRADVRAPRAGVRARTPGDRPPSDPGRTGAPGAPPAAPVAGEGRAGSDHLRIAEAARLVGTSASMLRQWERQGLLRPTRGPGRQRLYAAGDVAQAREVARLRAGQLNAPAIRRMLPATADPAWHGGTGGQRLDAAGAQLRALRLSRDMTLRDASRATGLSASFISSFERGLSGASLAALQRLTAAYGTTVSELLRGSPPSGGRLVRSGDRRAAQLGGPDIRMEDLSNAPTMLEAQLFVLAPGAGSDGWYAHDGEELMFVLAGSVGVWLAEREYYELAAGDALTFPSTLSHRFRALGDAETHLIWVNTPPTF